MTGLADPFGTAGLRARVLDAWAASPSRFREDANAEEDYALGGYRDRVIIELAQNAADAAVRGGVPGRLRLTLHDGVLTALNTGAPLDAAGVEALSTLRASSKRGGATGQGAPGAGGAAGAAGAAEARETPGAALTAGRFGVGFAAVVAVSDCPRIRSAAGTVTWSRGRTRDIVGAVPALRGELGARSGHVPVLRLPFAEPEAASASATAASAAPSPGTAGPGAGGPAPGLPPRGLLAGGGVPDALAAREAAGDAGGGSGTGLPEGFVTAVELPLRDDAAAELVRRLLAETGPALLLALPALTEVTITAGGATRLLTAACQDGLTVINVGGVPSAWRVAGAGGGLDPALLDGRPAEERGRASWSARWAVPVLPGPGGEAAGRLPGEVTGVVHAPTPTDEPLSLPALLIASFPLTPDRRHVAPGPLTDFLIERAADVYAGLLPGLPAGPGLLDLVPGPAGRGELDARLARAIAARLPAVPFLPAAPGGPGPESGTAGARPPQAGDPSAAPPGAHGQEGGARDTGAAGRVRPRDAVLLSTSAAGLAAWLAPALPNLVAGPARHPAWAVLGVRRLPLAELADLLASLSREPAWWHGLYAALAGVSAAELAELGALPVPLADGRLVRGPRGVLLPGPGLEHAGQLAVLGLRVADPAAAHPLLSRLGAVEATPRSALADAATRAAVSASYDRAAEAYYDDDAPGQVADAVLGLIAATGAEPGEYPWLADLALPGEDGDWYPAGELLLPDAPLAGVVAGDAPFGVLSRAFAERHDARVLRAAGVLSTFGLLRAEEVELDESAIDLDLDEAREWAAASREALRLSGAGRGGGPAAGLPPVAAELVAVRDLDLVDPGRWPQALDLLARPPLRAALTEPARVRLPGGGHADVPSYTAWWLRRHVTLGGQRPSGLRAADADPLLAGLYPAVGAGGQGPGEASTLAPGTGIAGAGGDGDSGPPLARLLSDPVIARALGVRSTLSALLAEPGGADDLLARLADPARPVGRAQLRALWSALAAAGGLGPEAVTPPQRVRAVLGDELTVADAAEVLVLDAPDLWPLVAGQPLVLAPYRHAARLADLLDLPLASEEVPGVTESAGERRPVPGPVREVLPGAPETYREHDRLVVDGADIPWRLADGELHAATVEGLASGAAWAAGRWDARHLLAALLISPEEAPRLRAEADLDW